MSCDQDRYSYPTSLPKLLIVTNIEHHTCCLYQILRGVMVAYCLTLGSSTHIPGRDLGFKVKAVPAG